VNSPGSNYPKSVVYLTTIYPPVTGAPSLKLYLKNGTVKKNLNGGDEFPRVKLPKLGCLFDNNWSMGVGGASGQKPISQKRRLRKFSRHCSCVQHIQMSQNQSFIWKKFIPPRRLGDNVISHLFFQIWPCFVFCPGVFGGKELGGEGFRSWKWPVHTKTVIYGNNGPKLGAETVP
jgi:hypothetical protein